MNDIWNINLIRNPQKTALISRQDRSTYYEAFCRENLADEIIISVSQIASSQVEGLKPV